VSAGRTIVCSTERATATLLNQGPGGALSAAAAAADGAAAARGAALHARLERAASARHEERAALLGALPQARAPAHRVSF